MDKITIRGAMKSLYLHKINTCEFLVGMHRIQ